MPIPRVSYNEFPSQYKETWELIPYEHHISVCKWIIKKDFNKDNGNFTKYIDIITTDLKNLCAIEPHFLKSVNYIDFDFEVHPDESLNDFNLDIKDFTAFKFLNQFKDYIKNNGNKFNDKEIMILIEIPLQVKLSLVERVGGKRNDFWLIPNTPNCQNTYFNLHTEEIPLSFLILISENDYTIEILNYISVWYTDLDFPVDQSSNYQAPLNAPNFYNFLQKVHDYFQDKCQWDMNDNQTMFLKSAGRIKSYETKDDDETVFEFDFGD